MPRLAEAMEEGTIVRWLKADGDSVAVGEGLVEIETDKAATTYDSEVAGVLTIAAAEGQTIAVGMLIAHVGDGARAEPPAAVPPAPTPPPVALPAPAEATPAAPRAEATPRAETETAKGETTITELTRGQQLIARRTAESRATVPAYVLRTTIDMRGCAELRASLAASGADPLPTYNDLVVKACANALALHPKANGAYRDGHFERYSRVNVGVAVAGQGTLVVPTVFDADRKRLGQIAKETRYLSERARAATITPPELAGGTFTVSNLGMFGVRSFEAVINSPQAAILALGAVELRPAARDGVVVVREQMDVELACDHRILYGADAAELLGQIRALLEEPLRMAL